MRRSLDAPQRPSQPSQRDDLLFLFFAQDIAHVTERNLSACSMSRFSYLIGRFSGVHVWPVLGVPRGDKASEQVKEKYDICVVTRKTLQAHETEHGCMKAFHELD
jgi:hypothetical protein